MIASPPTPRGRSRQCLAPGDLAERLTGRDYLSWSQVSTMRSCPRKFAFRYVENAVPQFDPSSLVFGGALHVALEHYCQQQLEGVTATLDDLVNAFKAAWDERDKKTGGSPVRFNKNEDRATLDDLAGRMLTAFLESDLVTIHGDIIAVEEELRGPLAPDLPDLLARIDLAWRADDGLHLLDFKSARARWTEAKAAESAEQLLLYRCMAAQLTDTADEPIHVHFGIISKAKKPTVQLIDVQPGNRSVEWLAECIRPVWEGMQTSAFFANPNPMNCSTCPFKRDCPAFNAV